MRYEYVVDLDVAAADGGGGARGTVERHVRDWMRRTVPDVPDLAGLENRGSRVSIEEPTGRESAVEWEAVGDDRTRALRLSLRVPQRSSDAVHVTLVTIGSAPSGVSVRIAMGPEVPDGQLAPVVQDYLRSPALVRRLVTDRSLKVQASTQFVDGRYDTVRTSAEVDVVLDALRHPHRLPVLVVSALDTPRWTFAEKAARELPGLAAVVALGSWEAWQRFDDGGRDTRVPRGGARLVWGLDVEHQPSYPSEQVLHHPVELVTTLLQILGRASVASRSRDRAWLAAQTAGRRAAVARSAAAGEAARAAGDERAQIEALTSERDQWQTFAEELDQERAVSEEDLTSRLAEATARLLQAETRNQWLISENARLRADERTPVVDWMQAPDLDRCDAGPLYDFLTESSGGTIAFHDAALKSWVRSGYAFPEKMRDTLVSLARSAVRWRELNGEVGSRVQEWFRLKHGLELALTDTEIARSGVAVFHVDGRRLDAEPHVKLGDKKHPREVGRIYFAFDEEESGKRFFVRHVGVHDFGG